MKKMVGGVICTPLGVHHIACEAHWGPQMPFGPFWGAISTTFRRFQDAIWVDFRLLWGEEFANMNPLFIAATCSFTVSKFAVYSGFLFNRIGSLLAPFCIPFGAVWSVRCLKPTFGQKQQSLYICLSLSKQNVSIEFMNKCADSVCAGVVQNTLSNMPSGRQIIKGSDAPLALDEAVIIYRTITHI